MSLWHCVVLFPRSTHTPIKGLTFAQKTISLLSLRMLTQSLIVPLLISNSVDNLKHFTETRAVSHNDDYCYKAIRTETINSSNKFQLQVYNSCMKYDEMSSSEQSQVFFNRIFSDSCFLLESFAYQSIIFIFEKKFVDFATFYVRNIDSHGIFTKGKETFERYCTFQFYKWNFVFIFFIVYSNCISARVENSSESLYKI